MITFKTFLCEGGKATEKWGTKRAKKADIEDALAFVSKHTGIPEDTLKDSLLGSTKVTLKGKKESSGDIDIAVQCNVREREEIMKKMAAATNNEVYWNGANKVASYAIPTKSGKVQTDLMFVPDAEWAKFAYHSGEGDTSQYSGTVRNLLLVSVAQVRHEPDKDFILKDDDGNVIARASRSYKLNTGLERLFKLAPKRKDGKGRTKVAAKVSPAELEKEMAELQPGTKFSHETDPIKNPTEAAEWLFWKGIKPADIMTAEQILDLIKSDKFTPGERSHIFAQCKDHFKNLNEKVPPEFK